jgi:hypothetical protein
MSFKEKEIGMKVTLLFAAAMFLTNYAFADCVYGAKDKTKFAKVDSRTLILSGGYGSDILIKTYTYISYSPSVVVLKDSFCSYDSNVLLIDGEVADVTQVTKL